MDNQAAGPSYSHFTPPPALSLPANSVAIEFCDRCRWQHRASWCQTELLVTFGPKYTPATTAAASAAAEDSGKAEAKSSASSSSSSGSLSCVALLPKVDDDSAGRFRVWVYHSDGDGEEEQGGSGGQVKTRATCVYDRKTMGRFPEMKELKQLVRDVISPGASLGHSDKKVGGQMKAATTTTTTGDAASAGGDQGQAP